MPLTLFLSAPVDPRPYGRAVMAARFYRGFQHLFGFDAQLRAFAEAAQQAGHAVFFLPAPEIFAPPLGLARLLEPLASHAAVPAGAAPAGAAPAGVVPAGVMPAGVMPAGVMPAGVMPVGVMPVGVMHVRFGMVRCQRVLKGVPTLAALAEDAATFPINLGRHPFARGDTLPAGCLHALTYQPPAARPRAHGGAEVAGSVMPETLALADLLRVAGRAGADSDDDEPWREPEVALPPGLQVQSLREFTQPGWSGEADAPLSPPSTDFRRVLLRQRAGAWHPGRSALVMIPWNMAHGGSILPLLVQRLARFCGRGPEHAAADGGGGGSVPPEAVIPVLFPFNLAYGFLGQLGQAVAALRAATESSPLSSGNVFLARLGRPRDAFALARLFPLAWIDIADPEHAFTRRRLALLGIPCAHVAPPMGPQAGDGPAPATAFGITADETLDITADDGFGARLYRAAVPSVRTLAALVRQTLAHLARPAATPHVSPGVSPGVSPPDPAAAAREARALAAFFAGLEQIAAPRPARGAARTGPRTGPKDAA